MRRATLPSLGLRALWAVWAVWALWALAACDGEAPTAAPTAGAPTSFARPRLSPRAEAVQVVCDGTAPAGSEDHRRFAERLEKLTEGAGANDAEMLGVLTLCATRTENPADVRALAVRSLAQGGVRDVAVPVVRQLLRDRSARGRLWHAHALGSAAVLKEPALLPDIAQTLVVTDEEAATLGMADVLQTATRVLAEAKTPAAWEAIRAAAADSRPAVREAVLSALGRLFEVPEARALLLAHLDDPVPTLRSQVCIALLYEVGTHADRRPDLFPKEPCHATDREWPEVSRKVRAAIATLDAYRASLPPPRPRSAPPGGARSP